MISAKQPRLRIGLLMDSLMTPAWAYRMLSNIMQEHYADIVLIVLKETPEERHRFSTPPAQNFRTLLYTMYTKFEDLFCQVSPNAFEPQDSKTLLAHIPILRVLPRQNADSDFIEDQDIERITAYNVDVFIRLGFKTLRGAILKEARYGVWSYHHGDDSVIRGGPPGFWEVFDNHTVTGSVLKILAEDMNDGTVLYRSYASTRYLSVKRNKNDYYWKSLSFVPRKLCELYDLGPEEFFRRVHKEHPAIQFYSQRIYAAPENREFLKLVVRHGFRYLKRALDQTLYRDQWILMFLLQNKLPDSLRHLKKIIPPKDRFWADPHVVFYNDKYYIFIEELIYDLGKGHISVFTIDRDGHHTKPVTIIDKPYHLSYPHIFQWHNDYYMIPETNSNRTIEVYKCEKFPYKWALHKVLMQDVNAVDTTLIFKQGKWWMLTNLVENEGASTCDELFLFYADSPLSSEWTPHPHNPIVSDVRKARPAGNLFSYGGHLYRPSQNCSENYGYGIQINRIVSLCTNEYLEQTEAHLEPCWDPKITGTHTFCHIDGLTMIDARVKQPKYW